MLDDDDYMWKEYTGLRKEFALPSSSGRGPFDSWNKGYLPRMRNCYAFACDALAPDLGPLTAQGNPKERIEINLYLPRPGTTGGKVFEALNASSLKGAIIRDGFIALPHQEAKNIAIPPDHYLVAGFCKRGNDYHFYRFYEPEGVWYHKPGWSKKVTNRDDKGKIIVDPMTAERGKYDGFIGYFLSPPDRMPMNIVIQDAQGNTLYGDPSPQRPAKQACARIEPGRDAA